MPANTAQHALPYPLPDDPPDGAGQIQALAETLDALPGLAPTVSPFVTIGPWDDALSWNVQPQRVYSVPHGLGVTPAWAIASASCGTSTVGANDPVAASILGMDITHVHVMCRFISGGNANLPSVYVYLLVLKP